MKIYQNF